MENYKRIICFFHIFFGKSGCSWQGIQSLLFGCCAVRTKQLHSIVSGCLSFAGTARRTVLLLSFVVSKKCPGELFWIVIVSGSNWRQIHPSRSFRSVHANPMRLLPVSHTVRASLLPDFSFRPGLCSGRKGRPVHGAILLQ